jgi:hypothetical protein
MAGKFFSHMCCFFVVIVAFLQYTLFHLLSASFVVLVDLWISLYYYIWRHFCLENYIVSA